ncbi:Fic family protein [Rathayibacter caricis]|uniref:Fic family protein n=1 Tax=Rathayibacter caricis TaxID=110936 RepID=UPI001FB223A6|nr:Fic family protein [Rathayibacter caricis]MCJ1695914.1 Fic family protein [Rathayibacter caricis]
MASTTEWPPHRSETRPWRQAARAGSRADRTLSEVVVSLPPLLAGLTWDAGVDLQQELDVARRAIIGLDARHGNRLGALGRLLLRTEAVSSSRIERVDATLEDYARATVGSRANAGALSMVAATEALTTMVDRAGDSGTIEEEALLAAHRTLLADDPMDGRYAGAYRTMQNWIGGSDYSPRDAIHVPPPPGTVPEYMTDLLAFANRDDVDPIVQAAIAHAQFESVHPFTDGNGRIGRALITAILRRRGLTTVVVVPIASALAARRSRYFSLVNEYRQGSLAPFVRELATAGLVAAEEAGRTAEQIERLPGLWAREVAPRAGSSAALLLDALLDDPVLTTARARAITGRAASSVGSAVKQLVDAGVLLPLTERTRDQAWVATDVLLELSDLEERIGAAMRLRASP